MNKPLTLKPVNHTHILEKLFNDIFQAPDLKKEILEYIQPEVLQAHELLNRHAQNGNNSTVLSLEFEEKRQIENLLYRDLPNLVSDYVSLDLTYRNEKRLKNNETHRQTLVQNLQFIVAKLNDLKESVFAGHDTKANTANQILEAKYGALQTQVQPIESDKYDWSKLKANLPQSYLEKTGFIQLSQKDNLNNPDTSQQKIALVDGKVQYRAKNLAVASMVKLKALKGTIKSKFNHKLVVKIRKNLFFPGIPIMMVVSVASLFGNMIYQTNTLSQTRDTFSDVITAMSNSTMATSRDNSIKMLQKMTNEQSLYYHKNLAISFLGKTVTASVSNISDSTCHSIHNYLDSGTIMTDGYTLNGVHVGSIVQDKDQYAHDENLCHMGNNTITLTKDMRTFDEQMEDMRVNAEKQALQENKQMPVAALLDAQRYAQVVRNNIDVQKQIAQSLINGLQQGMHQSVK